jgi:hypothetical protein
MLRKLLTTAVIVTCFAGLVAASGASPSHHSKPPIAHQAAWFSQIFNATWRDTNWFANHFQQGQGAIPYQSNYISPEIYGPYSNGVWYGHGFFVVYYATNYGILYRSCEVQIGYRSDASVFQMIVVDSYAGYINLEDGFHERDQ